MMAMGHTWAGNRGAIEGDFLAPKKGQIRELLTGGGSRADNIHGRYGIGV